MNRYPDRILRNVNNPVQYTGREFNMIIKDPEGKIRIALSYPDLYNIGMSSLGHLMIYDLFNKHDDVYAERVYSVEKDMESLLRSDGTEILTLETMTPLKKFDVIGFTLEYELTYTNMLQILDLGGIEMLSSKRDEQSPIVIAGGTAIYNPLPINEFIDVFFIGEGEGMIDDIVEIIKKKRWGEIDRNGALALFDELEYTYVPRLSGNSKDVIQKINENFKLSEGIDKPLVPLSKIVHDRAVVEISRGCTRGCRFCQAGMVYRPVREKSVKSIMDASQKVLNSTGYKELTLLSLSATDYSNIAELLKTMSRELSKTKSSISLPSLRIGDIDANLFSQISSVRKSGVTIAVESASERMKRIINKNISKDEIFETVKTGKNFGWKRFKLYFMVGLPFETDDDLVMIGQLLNELASEFYDVDFTASISPFVPRPVSPFQWVSQCGIEEITRKTFLVKNMLKKKNINFTYREADISYLEGVFARGDAKLNNLVMTAYKNGCRLDEWSEHFNFDLWKKSAEECGIELDKYLKKYDLSDSLPWDFIKTKVSKSFLEREYLAAENESFTNDCRSDKCTSCSACDGQIAGEKKHIEKKTESEENDFVRRKPKKIIISQSKKTHLFLLYSLEKEYQYLSHLGIINFITNGLKRTGLEFSFTQGFNPRMKIVYGPPKPVNVYSKMEMLEILLEEKPDSNMLEIINRWFPDGVRFYYFKELQTEKMSIISKVNMINMIFTVNPDSKMKKSISDFLSKESMTVTRVNNEKTFSVDIRKFIERIDAEDNSVRVVLKYSNEGGIKFEELYKNVLGIENLGDISVYREKFLINEDGRMSEVFDL